MNPVITGAGAVSPFGLGVGAFVDGVLAGRSTVAPSDASGSGRRATLSARVIDPLGPGPFSALAWRRFDRCSRMAVLAAAEALASAEAVGTPGDAATESALDSAGVGMVLGTMSSGVVPLHEFLATLFREGPESVSPMVFPFTVPNAPAGQCSILLGLKGPNLTLCQMEASGLGAIAAAATLIRHGAAEAILAGGVDEAAPAVLDAWRRMRVLARGEEFRGPFDLHSTGFAPGEGAYVVLLEDPGRARRRGASAWAEVSGVAAVQARSSTHGWPESADDPARGARLALSRAGLLPGDLGYVAAGASGARRLDALEAESLRRTFGARLRRLPVTALKGAVGESAGASAAAALLGALAIRDGFVPPIAALKNPDPRCDLNLVLGEPLRGSVPSVLVNAIGTGGACVSLVLGRPAA